MIRDSKAAPSQLTSILTLNTRNYGGFVEKANRLLGDNLHLPAGDTYRWAGEYEFEQRAKPRFKIVLQVVFFIIFMLLYMVFRSVAEAAVPSSRRCMRSPAV